MPRRMISKAFLPLLVAALVMMGAAGALCEAVYAEEEEHGLGLQPVEKESYQVQKARKKAKAKSTANLPEKYRSDQMAWATGIKVKDQGATELCWAFSISSAAEYSWAKELYEATGRVQQVQETSPGQLGYFLYHRVNDPLGNTAGDWNRAYGDWAYYGGEQIYGMQHLATYSGLGLEAKMPLGSTSYNDKYAYDDYLTLQNCDMYLEYPGDDKVKQLVYKYGAVSAGLVFYDRYMNPEEKNYGRGRSFYNYEYDKNTEYLNHAVTIVGWDDTYPKENFDPQHQPNEPGAWIVQNSFGTGEHEGGFFYVSYESLDFNASDISTYDMQPAETYRYNFQYDGTSDCGDTTETGNEDFLTTGGTSAANIYTNTTGGPVTLDAVGYTTYNAGATSYTIDVYTGLTDSADPTSGVLACTTQVSSATPGYKTAELKHPVLIEKGERYAIVFSFKAKTAFGLEKWRSPYYKVQVAAGQSFFRGAGSANWKDMANLAQTGACFRIKGLANPAVTSGTCGAAGNETGVRWSLSKGVLFISGSGAMADYSADSSRAPWSRIRNSIRTVLVAEGVSGVSEASFSGCGNLTQILDQGNRNTVLKALSEKAPKAVKKSAAKNKTLTKKKNPLKVSSRNKTYKKRKLKKKSRYFRAITVSGARGKVSCKVTYKNKKSRKALKFYPRTGKVRVKRGTRRGTYRLTVTVKAAGNSRYKAKTVRKIIKVRVK